MRKNLFLIILLLVSPTFLFAEKKPTPEQEEILEQYGDDLSGFYGLSDPELNVFVEYGDEDQSSKAEEILRSRQRRRKLENRINNVLAVKKLLEEKRGLSQLLYLSVEAVYNQLKSELDEIIRIEQENIALRNKSIQNEEDAERAKKEGDPVKITRGSYEQKETDFSTGTKLPILVNRNYDSESTVTSSFGYGWSTNLDERIILGTEPDARRTYTETTIKLPELEQIIFDFKNQIFTEYEITSLETGESEISDRFDSVLAECNSIYSEASSSGFSDISYSARAAFDSIEEMKTIYLSHFRSDLHSLSELQKTYNETKAENLSAKKRMEKSDQRRAQNSYALFPGMSKNFDGTGLATIILIDEDNYPHVLYESQAGIWQSENDKTILECRKTSTGFTVSFADGTEKTYDSNGFITKITDRNQNSITYSREQNETIKTAQNSFGEKLDFTFNGTFISQITNARNKNQTVSYFYDSKNLISVKDTDGDFVYMGYDSNERMTELKKCDGSRIQFIYDLITNDSRTLTTQTINEENYSEYFIYDLNEKKTIYIDQDQKESITYYDDRQRTICEIKNDGTENIYKYDDDGNLIETTTAGETTRFAYDERGNKIQAVYSDGSYEEFCYDNFNLLTYYKDRDGVFQEFIRDSRGNLIEFKTGGITQCIQNFNNNGNVIKSIVYCDKPVITEYEYDSFGNCTAQKKSGVSYFFEYDSLNRITKLLLDNKVLTTIRYEQNKIIRTDYNGLETTYITNGRKDTTDIIQKDTKLGIIHKTRIEYDKRHLPVKVFASDGNDETLIKQYSYTPAGNPISEEAAPKQSTAEKVLSTGGKLLKLQCEWGGFYEYQYDSAGLLKSYAEENTKGTTLTYYPDGSLKTKTDAFGTITLFNYDERGNLIRSQDSTTCLWYEFDKLDRIIKVSAGSSYSPGAEIYCISLDYSEDGRFVTLIEGEKYKTISELDAFGNIIKETDGNGNTREYEYNCQNQLIAAYDGYKNKTEYEYNEFGLIKTVTLPGLEKTEYEYTKDGQLKKIKDGCGIVYLAEYDDEGRIIKEKTRAQGLKEYEYDNEDRITKILCEGTVIQAYDYEQHGQKLTVTDAKGSAYFYTLDSFGRLISEKNRLGFIQNYSYDEEGNLKTQNNFDNSTKTISWAKNQTECTVRSNDGSETTLVYDAIGNITEAQNNWGKTIYKYDKGGRLIYQKDINTAEEIWFEYDAAGNRTRLVSSNRETLNSYGANNELKEIFDNKQRMSVQLQYNKNGWEILRKFGNGTTVQTRYDKAGRTTLKYQKNSYGEILWGEGYVYDESGKRTATVDTNARVTLYEYDKLGRLSAVYYPYTKEQEELLKNEAVANGLSSNEPIATNRILSANEKSALAARLNEMQYTLAYSLTTMQLCIKETYNYDNNQNRISKTTPFGKIEYSYDKENRLISSGSRGQTFVTYTYDNSGNLLKETSAVKNAKYTYNSQNRLISYEVTDAVNNEYFQKSYAYDAFGRRILVKDLDGSEQRTVYDGFTFDVIKTGMKCNTTGSATGDRYRYLSDDSTNYLTERTQFTANGTIAAQVSADGILYYATDLLDSVRTGSDETGRYADTYSYDAFGSVVQGRFSGTSDSGYLGKQYDPAVSLYNYGYRDYNPDTARFTTADPIRDGINWFTYCNADPVNFVDLWGLTVKDQGRVIQDDSTAKLGKGNKTIQDAGCVLTAYVRIAQAVSGKDITLEKANDLANDLKLYTDKDELSIENGVKLINALIKETGLEIVYEGSLEGTTTEIAKQINALEASDLDYYLTARIDTTNKDGTQKYEHTVSINSNSVFANDISDIDNSLNIRINDTSAANRQAVENDERENKVLRVDLFTVKEIKTK